jgi:GDPmannose 4,6-dehydratase
MKKRALITGVFGQDGSYLTELLLVKDYEVHGIAKLPLTPNANRIFNYLAAKNIKIILHECNLNSFDEVESLFKSVKPCECYHLSATHYSSEISAAERYNVDRSVYQNNVLSTLNILYAIRNVSPGTRFILAGSCLMYDGLTQSPQNELMPFKAKSIYGLSKIAAGNIVSYMREAYDLHLSVAILYNHESPRRSEDFVTRKIVSNLLKYKNKEITHFNLGDLKTVRDWGYAKDYVFGMWLMCQQAKPKNYILATGLGHTVEDFVSYTAELLQVDWRACVRVAKGIVDPFPATTLVGDPASVKSELNWSHSVSFHELIDIIVENEITAKLD